METFWKESPGKKTTTAAKNKRKKRQPKPKVEITRNAWRIKKEARLIWPGQEDKKELQFHQQNYNYAKQLDRRIRQLEEKMIDGAKKADKDLSKQTGCKTSRTSHWTLANCLTYLKARMSSPTDIAIWWAIEVNKTAWNWDGWRGKLLDWVLTDRTERLRQLLCRIVVEFCEDNSVWPKIERQLYGDNRKRKEN